MLLQRLDLCVDPRVIYDSRDFICSYSWGSPSEKLIPIYDSRKFTMVYTSGNTAHTYCQSAIAEIYYGLHREENRLHVYLICDSRNFTMVYTRKSITSLSLKSAIAEILLWFTPSSRLRFYPYHLR